jgi:chromosome partitioning protein
MPVVAVINRKGGSGKSTLATHIAAWCAQQRHPVMLGDVDRQQSSRAWLRRRDAALPSISPWAMDQNTLRVPTGISHVVLDTPGGIHGFELARVVQSADAIVIPVCASMFDRESAAACYAELLTLPRVASGHCRVGVVGMRIDSSARTVETLREWAEALGLPLLGTLRASQLYVRIIDRGMTIFDLPPEHASSQLEQWVPVLEWLGPIMAGQRTTGQARATRAPGARLAQPQPESVVPAQESLVYGTRFGVHSTRAEPHRAPPCTPGHSAREVFQFLKSEIPQFLKRHSVLKRHSG